MAQGQSAIEVDISHFRTAATNFGDKVWLSRPSHTAIREFIVANEWGEPGNIFLPELYSAAIGEMIRLGTLPQRVRTAAELEAEAAAAAELEARKKAGVMFSDSEPAKPFRKIADVFARDLVAEHNARTDAAFQAKQNPELARREQRAQLAERFTSDAIPGLVDDSFSANEVYVGGRVARYRTQQAVEAARNHNEEVRAKFAEQQAAAAEAAKSKNKGL
jgi:hypothetical protein